MKRFVGLMMVSVVMIVGNMALEACPPVATCGGQVCGLFGKGRCGLDTNWFGVQTCKCSYAICEDVEDESLIP